MGKRETRTPQAPADGKREDQDVGPPHEPKNERAKRL